MYRGCWSGFEGFGISGNSRTGIFFYGAAEPNEFLANLGSLDLDLLFSRHNKDNNVQHFADFSAVLNYSNESIGGFQRLDHTCF